ncbi:unnamed protein product [Staurois parvus]|uniref:Uncharacterized protein n=1 Tax=Staurois parvus TaxID=386267 RepID=A0ABN9DJP4_9NEOB|nr:unnamed protein product [Staurois parvus]
MKFFKIFKFAAGSGPRTSRRSQGPEHGSRHQPEEMAGDAAGDTSRESEGQGKCCRESLSNATW